MDKGDVLVYGTYVVLLSSWMDRGVKISSQEIKAGTAVPGIQTRYSLSSNDLYICWPTLLYSIIHTVPCLWGQIHKKVNSWHCLFERISSSVYTVFLTYYINFFFLFRLTVLECLRGFSPFWTGYKTRCSRISSRSETLKHCELDPCSTGKEGNNSTK